MQRSSSVILIDEESRQAVWKEEERAFVGRNSARRLAVMERQRASGTMAEVGDFKHGVKSKGKTRCGKSGWKGRVNACLLGSSNPRSHDKGWAGPAAPPFLARDSSSSIFAERAFLPPHFPRLAAPRDVANSTRLDVERLLLGLLAAQDWSRQYHFIVRWHAHAMAQNLI